jgi:hypothetical protein
MSDIYFDFRDVAYDFQWNITVHVTPCKFTQTYLFLSVIEAND